MLYILVKFDLDVEVHVVPRDSCQTSPIESLDTGQSDADSYFSIDLDDDAIEIESNNSSTSLSLNTEEKFYKSYLNGNQSEPGFDKNSIQFGKVSTIFVPLEAFK